MVTGEAMTSRLRVPLGEEGIEDVKRGRTPWAARFSDKRLFLFLNGIDDLKRFSDTRLFVFLMEFDDLKKNFI